MESIKVGNTGEENRVLDREREKWDLNSEDSNYSQYRISLAEELLDYVNDTMVVY